MLGALGVVYGDIGTSPLYSLQTEFALDNGRVRPDAHDVYGVVSLVFGTITLIVSLKYVVGAPATADPAASNEPLATPQR